MEKYLLNSPQSEENATYSLMAEMVLDRALLDFQRNRIKGKIDEALMNGNKEEFLKLTTELKKYS